MQVLSTILDILLQSIQSGEWENNLSRWLDYSVEI